MLKWKEIILSLAGVVALILLLSAIISSKQNQIARKGDFFSQCQLDGYKLTDCHVKWKLAH